VRFAAVIICAAMLGSSQGQTSVAVPSLPVYDWGTCPGEYCGYREWTVREAVPVYDTWKAERRVVARLAAGERVTGITGVVITFKPGLIRMDRDLPEQHLARGDTILTYGYSSEGYSAVWFQGRYRDEFDISFAKLPDGSGCGNDHCAATFLDLGKKSWWAEIKLLSGRTGWVDMSLGQIQVSRL
jgi:hypothetical protein